MKLSISLNSPVDLTSGTTNLPIFADELLPQITAYLDDADIQSLALAARARGLAQQAVHQYVDILRTGRGNRPAQFLRTLSERRGLAEYDRSLEVSACSYVRTILPPMDGGEQVADFLSPGAYYNDHMHIVFLKGESTICLHCVFWLAPH